MDAHHGVRLVASVHTSWDVAVGATELGPGDRSGLEIAGSGPCV